MKIPGGPAAVMPSGFSVRHCFMREGEKSCCDAEPEDLPQTDGAMLFRRGIEKAFKSVMRMTGSVLMAVASCGSLFCLKRKERFNEK